MTPQEFNAQSVGKGDKIMVINRETTVMTPMDVTGVDFDSYLYYSDELQIPCENVYQYIKKDN